MFCKNLVLPVLLSITCLVALSQDEGKMELTIGQAEKIFFEKNLLLLAQQYNISSAQALVIQAKYYVNPVISIELAAYSNYQKWFDIGRNGEKAFSVDQLISLAGKRNKKIALANLQAHQAVLAFHELLRTLRYELHENFYSALFANELIEQYNGQIQTLEQMINAYAQQAIKRNIALKDAVRLRSEYIQLSADRNAIVMESIEARKNLQLLMDTSAVIVPLKDREPRDKQIPGLRSLLQRARENRTDLQLQQNQVDLEHVNYKFQQALAVPDLIVGSAYDQQGNYLPHLYSVRAGIEIPLFNRNQGNIRAAKAQVKSAELIMDYKHKQIETEIIAGLSRLTESETEYQRSQQNFDKDFPEVNKAVIENFNKGNLSVLEFMDFFQNYNSTIRQINQLQKQRKLAWEELEFLTGSKLD